MNFNDKSVRRLSYGNFVTKFKNKDFDSLDYKLYKLKGDSLVVTSNNGNDLTKQQDGVYFVPKPGYGVVNKYSKSQIINAVDSVSRIPEQPRALYFRPAK